MRPVLMVACALMTVCCTVKSSNPDLESVALQKITAQLTNVLSGDKVSKLRQKRDLAVGSIQHMNSSDIVNHLSHLVTELQRRNVPGPNRSDSDNLQTYGSTRCGSVYTRWGRTTCDADGTSLIYNGFAAGTWYARNGGASNYLCLPSDPEYGAYSAGGSYGTISGVEYQSPYSTILGSNTNDQNVPCARCYSPRSAVMMLPAKRTCPSSWTKEYEGYLMASHTNANHGRTMYECVDREPEYIVGEQSNINGAVFYLVKADCEGLGSTAHCPPYHADKQITCVVCSK